MSIEDSTYAPLEAARILKLSRRRVQQLLEAGELEGYKDEAGRWFAYQWSVHELRSKRPNKEKLPERRDWLEEARAWRSEAVAPALVRSASQP